MQNKKQEMVTPRQAAQLRQVSLSYIYYELWANRIPGALKTGKNWLIPRDAIEKKTRAARGLGVGHKSL